MRRSQLVEEQINKLTSIRDERRTNDSKNPAVQKLPENKVYKLKQIFEEKTANNNHYSKPPSKKSSPSQILRSLDCIRRSSKSPKSQSPTKKIGRIITELIDKEQEYIGTLENGIKNYIDMIANPLKCHIPIPREIKLQKFKLFGNIEAIFELHRATVLPQIIACENNVEKIAQTFIKFIDNDTLYCYIDYVITHLHSTEMVASYLSFFQALQYSCNDRLGVQSFILQPIQKLPRYPLLFEEMIKELSADMQQNKSSLAALCIAKKKFERYLSRMNQALRLNDIVETHDVAISIQCGALTTLQLEFCQDINTPTFFIVPSITCFSDYRSPVNIFDLGRFIIIETFECQEHDPYFLYISEIFLFEKCLLYTKKCGRGDKNCLSYRDNFKFGPHTSIHLEQEHNRFTMGDIKSNKIVTFTSGSIEKIVYFCKLVKNYLDRCKLNLDGDKNSMLSDSTRKPTKSYASHAMDDDCEWSSDESIVNFSSCDDFEMIKNF